jgi:anaerobic carbon-monoxide dehydrogenase iron sulfur subunit
MKRIHVNEEVCIGCRLCEVHCIVQHSRSKVIIKAFREEELPESAIHVEEQGPLSFALQCRHCDDAPCIEACISGAMAWEAERGTVNHDDDKCVGCWSCVMVCPFGAILPDLEKHKVGSKCDLCIGAAEPACVAHCPNEALTYE